MRGGWLTTTVDEQDYIPHQTTCDRCDITYTKVDYPLFWLAGQDGFLNIREQAVCMYCIYVSPLYISKHGSHLSFGERLRHLRRKSGYSQLKLGKAIFPNTKSPDVSIARYEGQTRLPPLTTIQDIARVFNMTLAEFLIGVDTDGTALSHTLRKKETT